MVLSCRCACAAVIVGLAWPSRRWITCCASSRAAAAGNSWGYDRTQNRADAACGERRVGDRGGERAGPFGREVPAADVAEGFLGVAVFAAAVANATFAARREVVWGTGTGAVASDSTHFGAFDQNLFTQQPGFGRIIVPGIGGPGLKRNDRVTRSHRWISRYMVYQLHTQATLLTAATARIAAGLGNIGPGPLSLAAGQYCASHDDRSRLRAGSWGVVRYGSVASSFVATMTLSAGRGGVGPATSEQGA